MEQVEDLRLDRPLRTANAQDVARHVELAVSEAVDHRGPSAMPGPA
jgi:hypothetical protein